MHTIAHTRRSRHLHTAYNTHITHTQWCTRFRLCRTKKKKIKEIMATTQKQTNNCGNHEMRIIMLTSQRNAKSEKWWRQHINKTPYNCWHNNNTNNTHTFAQLFYFSWPPLHSFAFHSIVSDRTAIKFNCALIEFIVGIYVCVCVCVCAFVRLCTCMVMVATVINDTGSTLLLYTHAHMYVYTVYLYWNLYLRMEMASVCCQK